MSERCDEIIAGHRVVRLLGRGGMAEVYEVEHVQLGLRRAMKVFTAEGERAEFLKSRFLAEGRLLARLDHPRLVKVYDCGIDETSGRPYLTMDLVLGAANYLAPEVRRGDAATASSDIFALGVTLFRLLTGVWYEPDSKALDLLDGYDSAWRGIFAALLSDSPLDRALPPVRRASRRKWFWAAAAAVVVLAMALSVWFLIGHFGGAKSPRDVRTVDDLFFFPK